MKTSRKTLYRIFLALILVKTLFFTDEIMAQAATGIYLTAVDFTEGKPSFFLVENKKCKIRICGFSFHSPIKITCGKQKLRISKDSVYGYIDKEHIAHRFYNKAAYEILNPTGNILLYRVMISGKTKYEKAMFRYYFSKTAGAPVLPLTLNNVENVFAENILFTDFIEIHFKTDSELIEYDQIHKQYKLNRLLDLSKN